jgi:hypothetical protein
MLAEPKAFSQKKPDQLVYLELGGGNGGMLLSLSEEGFRFRAVTPVPANGDLPFAFSLDGKHRFEGVGVIEWVEDDGKSGGMRFTEVTPEFRTALAIWISSDSTHRSTGRETLPAAATPPDTMERIRQELRAGYPARPSAESVLKSPQVEAGPADASPVRNPKPPFSQPEAASRIRSKSEPKVGPIPTTEPKPRQSQISSRLFPLPVPSAPEKPASAATAFLKQQAEPQPAPAKPVISGPTQVSPTISQANPAAPLVVPSVANPVPQRPYIPPLEDSFESAWERAKLTAPPNSPHLSRAASGAIITIALAAILGTLGYSFRQNIGGLFIQIGQSISGETNSPPPAATPAAAPEQLKAMPEGRPAEGQGAAQKQQTDVSSQDGPAESSNALKPPSASPNANLAPGNTSDGSTPPKSRPTTSGAVQASPALAPPSTAKLVQDPAMQAGTAAAESETGQNEFNAARDILRGKNRQQDLARAVDLLWSGVRKGYVPAEVTLADLFRRGDGVEKNCDQARVLLVAASKKGSNDARQMLEKMAEQGCE